MLFFEILKLCKEACDKEGRDFGIEMWEALWHLIELITQSLDFSPSNMLYEPELLQNVRFKEMYDQCFTMSFMEQDAQGALLDLWKTMYNYNKDLLRENKITTGLNAVESYRNLFESPGTTSDMVEPLLKLLSNSFRWNYFSNYMRKNYENLFDQERFKFSIVEWMLLQQVCEQAKNQLLELILTLWKPETKILTLVH